MNISTTCLLKYKIFFRILFAPTKLNWKFIFMASSLRESAVVESARTNPWFIYGHFYRAAWKKYLCKWIMDCIYKCLFYVLSKKCLSDAILTIEVVFIYTGSVHQRTLSWLRDACRYYRISRLLCYSGREHCAHRNDSVAFLTNDELITSTNPCWKRKLSVSGWTQRIQIMCNINYYGLYLATVCTHFPMKYK